MELKNILSNLSEQVQEQIKNCKNTEEIITVLKNNGIEITQDDIENSFVDGQELSDDDLNNVTGGLDIMFLLQELFGFTFKKLREDKETKQW